MRLEAVSARLRRHRADLERLGVNSLALFGSTARGDAGPDSDVDLLVEFSRPVGLFGFVRLQRALERILDCGVDLATLDALRESTKDDILKEAVDVIP